MSLFQFLVGRLGSGTSVALLEGMAVVLFVLGFYVSERQMESFIGKIYPWIGERRTKAMALFDCGGFAVLVVLFLVFQSIGWGSFLVPELALGLPAVVVVTLLMVPDAPEVLIVEPIRPTRSEFFAVAAVFAVLFVIGVLFLPVYVPL